ncbi:hypothetical protein Q9L58_005228 [Maublancomyces gigas]|uniref:glucan 1,3-beta-glucosidase n=1 Tax=Discina gigas TaxID=1032678 RepID=A0ABR3GIP0_9PEZI
MKLSSIVCGSLLAGMANAWLPAADKIRGVNLGGLFIVEPWMMSDEWNAMGCGGTQSEFDCVLRLGQAGANTAFQAHWNRWITQDDINQIKSLGLNTIRIPVGYWIMESLIDSSEHFPRGGFQYLERVCGWAKAAGLYVIIDLHGAPGAQDPQQPFTGQYAPSSGFYGDYNYERAYKFLEWITNIIHTNSNFWSTGTVQLVNEPERPSPSSLVQTYYHTAFTRIRAVEAKLGTARADFVHIQMMNNKWGSGDPNANLPDKYFAFYDDHHYVKWSDVAANRDAYMRHSCHDDRSGNTPVVTGEWSLSVNDSAEWGSMTITAGDAVAWYRKWWGAQVLSYEKIYGWIFWNWKVNWINGRNDWRWGYQSAVAAGVIPTNPLDVYSWNVCAGF